MGHSSKYDASYWFSAANVRGGGEYLVATQPTGDQPVSVQVAEVQFTAYYSKYRLARYRGSLALKRC